jgi:hypothetical protein
VFVTKLSAIITELTEHHMRAGEDRCVQNWDKCGGKGIRGELRCCDRNYECKRKNEFYSQCRPKRESECRYHEFITGKNMDCRD